VLWNTLPRQRCAGVEPSAVEPGERVVAHDHIGIVVAHVLE
jgi:hypothetical protein